MTNLEAELYALTHRGSPGDREFYVRTCSGVSSVLELGTGYGRLLPALLGEGRSATRRVVGLEIDPGLLRSARRVVTELSASARARVRLVRGDMERFELGERFERIVLPYNGLYCLSGRRALGSCLRSVERHLAPGGLFVFDVWAADRFLRHAGSRAHRDDDEPIVSLDHRGQTWDVFEQSRLRAREQRLDVIYTYRSRERGRCVEIRIPQRYPSSRELEAALSAVGLRVQSKQGYFSGGPGNRSTVTRDPATHEDERLIVVAGLD